jgi:hypothetical protein
MSVRVDESWHDDHAGRLYDTGVAGRTQVVDSPAWPDLDHDTVADEDGAVSDNCQFA